MNEIYLIEIEKFISYLKTLSTDKLTNIQQGVCNISFSIKTKENKLQGIDNGLVEMSIIVEQLYALNSRLEGEQYLSSKNFKKGDLESIARKLDIHFSKKDNIKKLSDKIVERTIGFRLRSKAIQGVNTKQENLWIR